MIIVTNRAPENGVFLIDPLEGEVMNTTFAMRTYGWLDDPEDYPLMYTMTYFMISPDEEVMIRAASENPRAVARLAQGFESMQYRVTVRLKTFDIFEGVAYSHKVVT